MDELISINLSKYGYITPNLLRILTTSPLYEQYISTYINTNNESNDFVLIQYCDADKVPLTMKIMAITLQEYNESFVAKHNPDTFIIQGLLSKEMYAVVCANDPHIASSYLYQSEESKNPLTLLEVSSRFVPARITEDNIKQSMENRRKLFGDQYFSPTGAFSNIMLGDVYHIGNTAVMADSYFAKRSESDLRLENNIAAASSGSLVTEVDIAMQPSEKNEKRSQRLDNIGVAKDGNLIDMQAKQANVKIQQSVIDSSQYIKKTVKKHKIDIRTFLK